MTKKNDYGKLLQAMYDQGFADCEAAAKLAIKNGIKHAILAEREACVKIALKYEPTERHRDVTYAADEMRARGNK
jgi:hypothetical protein